jgi:hypothetical protein
MSKKRTLSGAGQELPPDRRHMAVAEPRKRGRGFGELHCVGHADVALRGKPPDVIEVLLIRARSLLLGRNLATRTVFWADITIRRTTPLPSAHTWRPVTGCQARCPA